MNRREALAALTSMPGLTKISRADVQPHDVLVLEVAGGLSKATAIQLKALVEEVFPGHTALVLADGITLKVLSQKATE